MTVHHARPTGPCKHCRGTGRVQLAGALRAAWYALRQAERREGRLSSLPMFSDGYQEMGALLAILRGVKRTALINRLQRLRALGLVQCRSVGRSLVWRISR